MADIRPVCQRECTSYILAVTILFVSFGFQLFGYINKAWVVIDSEDQLIQFQRGIGHDCFLLSNETIKCEPWNNGSHDFPPPFDNTSDGMKYAALLVNILFWVPLIFGVIGCVLLYISALKLDSIWKFVKPVFLITAFLYVVLLPLLLIIFRLTDTIIPEPIPKSYKVSFGFALLQFAIGGILCLLGLYFILQAQKDCPVSLRILNRNSARPGSVPENVPLAKRDQNNC